VGGQRAIIEQTLAMSVDEAMAQIEGIPDEIVGVLGTVLAGEIWPWYAGQLEIILDGSTPAARDDRAGPVRQTRERTVRSPRAC
jgi:hypothetical protein